VLPEELHARREKFATVAVTAILLLYAEEADPAGAVVEDERDDAALGFGLGGIVGEEEGCRRGGVVGEGVLGCAVLRGSGG